MLFDPLNIGKSFPYSFCIYRIAFAVNQRRGSVDQPGSIMQRFILKSTQIMDTLLDVVRLMALFVYPEPLFIDGRIIVLFN
jgi:hypothetical protein